MNRRHFLASAAALSASACAGLQPVRAKGQVARPFDEGFHHIGNATHLLVMGTTGILTDPWVHEPAERILSHRIAPAPLPEDPDLVLITHEHQDHYDERALAHLSPSATLVVPHWMKERAQKLGFVEVIGVKPGDRLEVRGVLLDVVQGAHDIDELCYRVEHEGHALFFGGDSLVTDEIRALARRRPVELCILPAERSTFLGTRYSMSPEEAIELVSRFGAERAILSHHESYVSHALPYGWMVDVPEPDPADMPDWFHVPSPGQFLPFPWSKTRRLSVRR